VTKRTAAARYARAMFDVAVKEADPQAVERELASFAELVREHALLATVLANPAVPAPRKRALVEQLSERAALSATVSRLLCLLAARDRLALLEGVLEEYRRRLFDHQRVVRAEVTSAVPLDAAQVAALGQALARVTGRQVQMTAAVDSALLGGAVTRIGSMVYDGSVKRQLERLRDALREGT